MIEAVEIKTNAAKRRGTKIARVARDLAGYGFYVRDARLPDDVRAAANPRDRP